MGYSMKDDDNTVDLEELKNLLGLGEDKGQQVPDHTMARELKDRIEFLFGLGFKPKSVIEPGMVLIADEHFKVFTAYHPGETPPQHLKLKKVCESVTDLATTGFKLIECGWDNVTTADPSK
jgi:hypothetical protein